LDAPNFAYKFLEIDLNTIIPLFPYETGKKEENSPTYPKNSPTSFEKRALILVNIKLERYKRESTIKLS